MSEALRKRGSEGYDSLESTPQERGKGKVGPIDAIFFYKPLALIRRLFGGAYSALIRSALGEEAELGAYTGLPS